MPFRSPPPEGLNWVGLIRISLMNVTNAYCRALANSCTTFILPRLRLLRCVAKPNASASACTPLRLALCRALRYPAAAPGQPPWPLLMASEFLLCAICLLPRPFERILAPCHAAADPRKDCGNLCDLVCLRRALWPAHLIPCLPARGWVSAPASAPAASASATLASAEYCLTCPAAPDGSSGTNSRVLIFMAATPVSAGRKWPRPSLSPFQVANYSGMRDDPWRLNFDR